jgi:hypothetical protein
MQKPYSLLLATVIATNINPPVRELGANYFDALKESQVWINLEPRPAETGPNPIVLNVTVAFPGDRLNQEPEYVQFRAQPLCSPLRLVYPLMQPTLRFVLDGQTEIDLTRPGQPYQLVSSCGIRGRSSQDTIVTRAPFAVLQTISNAHDVSLNALGFTLSLASDDLSALRNFVNKVSDGVIIRRP